MKNIDKYFDADYQRACGDMVARNVHACASTLIAEIAPLAEEAFSEWSDELLHVCVRYDYQEALINAVNDGDVDRDQIVEWLHEVDLESCEGLAPMPDKDLRECAAEHIESMDQPDQCELASEWGLDIDPVEAYEHWIVDRWFGEQLSKRGEMVEDVLGLCIWGRTTTGQAIAMDRVICDIYDSLHGDEWRGEVAA